MNWLTPAHLQSCLNRCMIGEGGGGGTGAVTAEGTTLRGMRRKREVDGGRE